MNAKLTKLPEGVARKLVEVEHRERGLNKVGMGMKVVAVFLVLMLVAMALDYFLTLFALPLRFLLSFLAVLGSLLFFHRWFVSLMKRRDVLSLAGSVDRSDPKKMLERVSTVTELAAHEGERIDGSPHLIAKVRQEAETLGSGISAREVVGREPLRIPVKFLGGVAVVLLILFVVDVPRGTTLLKRFWAPWSDASLTKLSIPIEGLTVARGEDVTLRAQISGRLPKDGQVEILMDSRPKQMVKLTCDRESLNYVLRRARESFSYRFRAGDGQTKWQQVLVGDRPKIAGVTLKIVPPAYTKLSMVEQDALPGSIRLVEGSVVALGIRADQELRKVELNTRNGKTIRMNSAGDWYRFDRKLADTLAVSPVLTNREALENANPPQCEFVVYPDERPDVELLASSDEHVRDLEDTLMVAFAAKDDFGIDKAEIVLTIAEKGKSERTVSLPVELGDQRGAESVSKEVVVDLAKLGIKGDAEVSYAVKVADNRPGGGKASAAMSEKEGGEAGEGNSGEGEGETGDDDQPEFAMKTRMSDLESGCSQCDSKKLKIGEHVGEYTGEGLEKLEIAIEPVITELKEILGRAREKAKVAEVESLLDVHGDLVKARAVVEDLESKTKGTPYEFMGLQIRNIEATQIVKAQERLTPLLEEEEVDLADVASGAEFHIGRALAMLDELSRLYDLAKAENRATALAQEIEKMHHIFAEDMMAILKNLPPNLNPRSRKMIEVSEKYAEALQKLTDAKRELQKKLAALLAEHPDLMARYMDKLNRSGRSLRDQLTLVMDDQNECVRRMIGLKNVNNKPTNLVVSEWTRMILKDEATVAEMAAEQVRKAETWKPDGEDAAEFVTGLVAVHKLLDDSAKGTFLTNSEIIANWENALTEVRELESWCQATMGRSSNHELLTYLSKRIVALDRISVSQQAQLARMESMDRGELHLVAWEEQNELWVRTGILTDKIIRNTMAFKTSMPEVASLCNELETCLGAGVLTGQKVVLDTLEANDVRGAGNLMRTKVQRNFSRAADIYDDLLDKIIEKLDAEKEFDEEAALAGLGNPPSMTLEALMAMLASEIDPEEGFGIPCSPMNVMTHSDWPSR
jgi:hypothetical protein